MDSIEGRSGDGKPPKGWGRLRPRSFSDYVELLLFIGAAAFLAYLLLN